MDVNTLLESLRSGDLNVDGESLQEWLTGQRWFSGKAERVASAEVIAAPLLAEEPVPVVDAFVEVRVEAGTHDIYQVPLAVGDASSVSDALADPGVITTLVELLAQDAVVQHGESRIRFESVDRDLLAGARGAVRVLPAEHSNTSHVVGDDVFLKVYRRLEAGPNPELELLGLFERQGFRHAPRLAGFAVAEGAPIEATLVVAQSFVRALGDGWTTTLAALTAGEDVIPRLGRLGEITGEMHTVLASDRDDPVFAPQRLEAEATALLLARIEEEIDDVFRGRDDDPQLGGLPSRTNELREHVRALSQIGAIGSAIRIHGDYHLGQVVWDGDDWTILDFEGEPARSLVERRQKRFPLSDVAGMLRSFAYASEASTRAGRKPRRKWERDARAAFLAGYRERVNAELVPTSTDELERLLRVFEIQKAVYELRYELNNRPDWVPIPVATLTRLLDDAAGS